MKKLRNATLTIVLITSTFIGGCTAKPDPWLMEKSSLQEKPLALVESRFIEKKPLTEFSDKDIAAAAHAYSRTGAGPLYLVVAHGETAKSDITNRTKTISNALQKQGIAASDIIESTVPLTTDTPVVLVAFDTLEAQAPTDCADQTIPGLKSLHGKPSDFDYKFGCSVKSYMAKQIAKPTDLQGVAGLGGETDSEHAASTINTTLRSGEPRDFLPSYVISVLAGSGG